MSLSFYVCDARILVMSRASARSPSMVLAIALAMVCLPVIAMDTIVITGEISLDPDPATSWNVASDQSPDEKIPGCSQATSANECAAIEGCAWVVDPRGTTPGGSPGEYCDPVGSSPWELDRDPRESPPIVVHLDGITVTEASTAFAIVAVHGDELDKYPPQGYSTVAPDQTSVDIEIPAVLIGPGVRRVIVCINSTTCPGWNQTCSTCVDTDKTVQWTDPDTGDVANDNPISPLVWISTPFTGHPSLWEDEVDRVTATMAVTTFGMDWLAECWLEGENEDNSANITLCGRGVLSPDICTFQSPTGNNAVEVAITLSYDQVDWYAGRYRLVCYINGVRGTGFASSILDTGFMVERRVPLAPLLFGNVEEEEVLPTPTPKAPGVTEGPLVIPEGPPLTSTPACGDNRCDPGETVYNCCMDCGCPMGMACTDNTCTPAPTPAPKGTDSTNVAVIGAVLLIALVGYMVLRPRA